MKAGISSMGIGTPELALHPDMLLALLMATARAAGLTPEKLAKSFMANKEGMKFGKLFLAEVIREGAERFDEENE